jgi:predicted Zn-dependent protease
MTIMHRLIAVAVVLAVLGGCARQNQSISDLPADTTDEVELGEAIHREILEWMPASQNQELADYVQGIGQNIVIVSGGRQLQYRFIVLEDERVYATHAPGGYVYLTTGLIRFLENETELAGVLAHEIGALQYKDPRLSQVKKALGMVVKGATYVGPAFGTIGSLSTLGLVAIGAVANRVKSSEDQVFQADRHALRYLVEAGYDPQGLIHVLYRMTDPASPAHPYLYDYLQTHPITPRRFKRLDETFRSLNLAGRQFDARRELFLQKTQSVRTALHK